jgi:hypothetical protein
MRDMIIFSDGLGVAPTEQKLAYYLFLQSCSPYRAVFIEYKFETATFKCFLNSLLITT